MDPKMMPLLSSVQHVYEMAGQHAVLLRRRIEQCFCTLFGVAKHVASTAALSPEDSWLCWNHLNKLGWSGLRVAMS